MIQSHMSESHWHRFPDRITIFVTFPLLLSSAWLLLRKPPAEYTPLDYRNDNEKQVCADNEHEGRKHDPGIMLAICLFSPDAGRKPYVKNDDTASKEQNNREILKKSEYVTHFHEISRIYSCNDQFQCRYSKKYNDHDPHHVHHNSAADSQASTPL